MHEKLAAIIAESRTPTHVGASDVAALLRPLLTASVLLQSQNAVDRMKVIDLETADDAPADIRGRTEKFHQTLDRCDKDIRDAIGLLRRAHANRLQFERYCEEAATREAALDAGTLALPAG